MTVYQRKLVQEALMYYGFKDPDIRFIRHNENIICRVTENGCSYALRIHLPVRGFSLDLYGGGSPLRLRQGEMELLLHLSQTAPFPVQIPVRNKHGEYITLLPDGIPCELLRWVEGTLLDKDDADSYAGDLGILAAQIHKASEGFAGVRLSYSYDLVKKTGVEIYRAVQKRQISKEQAAVCGDVLEEVEHIMASLEECPDAKSLIHADLSFGNVILTPQGLAPIDFSLSGFGYKAQECGMLAANYESKEAQERIRTSYEEESGIAIEKHHMEAFLAFSVLLFVAAQHNRYGREKWFQDCMVRWTKGLFRDVI